MLSKGFTLLELMIVVAIIGIIASIAYPSYQGYMESTYQAQALADLQVCSSRLERYYSNDFSYANADTDGVCEEHSPADQPASNKRYTLTYQTLTANEYVIRMTPVDTGECIELSSDGTQSSC